MVSGAMPAATIGGIAVERRGRGAPLLLLHGTGGSRLHWKPLLGPLSPYRELLLVDLPGHGVSDPPPPGVPHTATGYAQLLASVLDALGFDSVHVAGNSLGGWTALELAKLSRARSVVAVAPAGLWRERPPRSARLRLRGQYRLGRLFGPALPPLLRTAAGRALVLGAVVGQPWRLAPEDAIKIVDAYLHTRGFARHLAATRHERFRDGGAIHVPVTVAWGERERLIAPSSRGREELPAHTRYLTLPGCGHLAMWDDPQLVADTILKGTSTDGGTPRGRASGTPEHEGGQSKGA
jgi:pimeloyl-ACP methyl ester carboxylesterase